MNDLEQAGVLDHRFLSRSLGLLNPLPPIVVNERESVDRTLAVLRANKTGCVAVIEASGKLIGIFSERDVVLKVIPSEIDLQATPICELMTKSPKTATMTTTLAYALTMMSHGGYRHIPIVDDTQYPVGMVSVKDIIDYIVNTLLKETKV